MLTMALAFALAQNAPEPKGFELVDDGKVAAAIAKGVAYLRTAPSPNSHHDIQNSDELILYTLVNAGVPETDPGVEALVAKILAVPLERTYPVALQAMCLEHIDRVKHQDRIWQCAQFLVDNQNPDGRWGYGEATQAVKNIPSGGPKAPAVASGSGKPREAGAPDAPKEKPKVARKLSVAQTKQGNGAGDSSNSQYAALGLRACHDAGIKIPEQVILLAKKFWYDTQHANENGKGSDKSVASGPGGQPGTPRGWCYQDTYGVCNGGPAYATMTAGAVGAICIYDYLQGRDWKKNEKTRNGVAWLAANWSLTEVKGPSEVHEGKPNAYWYYYLYAIERVGMLYDIGKIGGNWWYPDGAKILLDAQQADGSWDESDPKKPTWDTCFAILFLKRATRPLVASGGGKK